MANIDSIEELLFKPKPFQGITKYIPPLLPFVKTAEKASVQIPFHDNYTKKILHKTFCTGSSYSGSADSYGLSGKGTYTYPHGVIYEGGFLDGQFHGEGVLRYPRGQEVKGMWFKGKLVGSQFLTNNKEVFNKDEYLEFPNRIKPTEINDENKVICNEEELAEFDHDIPPMSYDTCDGFYDAKNFIIFNYEGNMKRIATLDEAKCFVKKYRQKADNPVEYFPELYEFWTSGRSDEIAEIIELFKKRTTLLTDYDKSNRDISEIVDGSKFTRESYPLSDMSDF